MSNASANYILKAQDQTQGAVRSVMRGFESLDKSARRLSQGFKALGIGALAFKAFGAASREADVAIRNLADSNAAFAASVAEGERAMRDMRTAGLETIEAQKKLNESLSDPEVQAASKALHDSIAARMIDLKRYAFEALAGLSKLDEALGIAEKRAVPSLLGPSTRRGAVRDLGDLDAARRLGGEQNKAFDAATMAAAKAAQDRLKIAEAERIRLQGIWIEGLQEREKVERSFRDVVAGTSADIRASYDDIAKSLDDFADEGIAKMGELLDSSKEQFGEMSAYAADFARSMDGSIKHALLNLSGGFRGLAASAVDSLRDIMAEIAALKLRMAIFGKVDDAGNLSGGLLSGLINGVFDIFGGGKAAVDINSIGPVHPRALGGPVAAGRSYLVGENGPELFLPKSNGTILPNGRGAVVNVYQNVDARGATVDAVKLLPSAMKEASDDAVARVQRLVKEGRI